MKHSPDGAWGSQSQRWPEFLGALKPFGRYVAAGAIAGPLVELDVRTLYQKDLSLLGCTVLGKIVFPSLIKHIEAGKVSSVVANTFTLPEVPKTQQQFEKKGHIGRLVIDISSER